MSEEKLPFEKAVEMLPPKETVHTFRIQSDGLFVGTNWPRHAIVDRIKNCGAELAKEWATKMKHGLVSIDVGADRLDFRSWLLIETKRP